MSNTDNVQSSLPLSEVVYFILLSLASGPRHGYAIMKEVRSLSKDRVTLSTGTLYGAIKRMLEQGWIQRLDDHHSDDHHSANSGRQRKVYKLTDLGWRVLRAEIERLDSLIIAARVLQLGRNA